MAGVKVDTAEDFEKYIKTLDNKQIKVMLLVIVKESYDRIKEGKGK